MAAITMKKVKGATAGKLIVRVLFAILVAQCGIDLATAINTEIQMGSSFWMNCDDMVYGTGGTIRSDEYSIGGFDCQVTVQAYDYSQRFYIYFASFDIDSQMANCSDHKLEIFDGDDRFSSSLTGRFGLCDPQDGRYFLPPPIKTTGDKFTMYLYRDENNPSQPEFTAYFAAFKGGYDDCYKCGNKSDYLCIDSSLQCDGAFNCPDNSDESFEENGGCSEIVEVIFGAISVGILIAIILAVLGVIGCIVCIVCIACFCRHSNTGNTTTTTSTTVGGTQPTVSYPTGTYPQQQYTAPPAQGAYPQQPAPTYPQGGYPQAPPAYPATQGAYPPPQGGYPPPSVNYSVEQQHVDIQQKV
ncbi:uncharacterized protein LOC144438628 [Glandiceps talaboti]